MAAMSPAAAWRQRQAAALPAVHRLHHRIARRKMPVQGADAYTRPARDLLPSSPRPHLREGGFRRFHQQVAVTLRIGARLPAGFDLIHPSTPLAKRRLPPYISGDTLRLRSAASRGKGRAHYLIKDSHMTQQFARPPRPMTCLPASISPASAFWSPASPPGSAWKPPRALIAHGATVVGAARDLAKAKTATARYRCRGTDRARPRLAEKRARRRRCAGGEGPKIRRRHQQCRRHGLPVRHTSDGFETQFGTNHLGHFVFTNRILPVIAAGGRVVSLASSGHRFSDVNLEDPNFVTTEYSPFAAYGRSKNRQYPVRRGIRPPS